MFSVMIFQFFKPVWVLTSFVPDYENECETKENMKQTGLKNFKPRTNLIKPDQIQDKGK